ncbi:MAG: O-antigen ligase family protein [Porticoccaceae bacterium]|nr:O-antigen ligase family protein [Porticoccaceae bacterium]
MNRFFDRWSAVSEGSWLLALTFALLVTAAYVPFWGFFSLQPFVAIALVIFFVNKFYRGYGFNAKTSSLLLAMLFVVNVIVSELPAKSITAMVSMTKGLLLFYPAVVAGYFLAGRPELQTKIVKLYFLANLAFALWVYVAVLDRDNFFESLLLWSNHHLGNMHNFNNFLFFSLLAGVVGLSASKTWMEKSLFVIASGFVAYLCLLAKSEGAVYGLVMTGLFYGLFFSAKKYRPLFAIAILGWILLLIYIYVNPGVVSVLSGYEGGSLQARSEIFSNVFQALDGNLLFGLGVGTFRYIPEVAVNGENFIHPHNIYLEILYSFGLVGVLVLAFVFWSAARRIELPLLKSQQVCVLLFLMLVYYSAKGMSDIKLLYQPSMSFYAIAIGFLVGATQFLKKGAEPGVR